MSDAPIISRPEIHRPSYSENNRPPNDRRQEQGEEQRRRPIRVYVGDMVKVTDNRSRLYNKYGLVELVDPRGREFQVIVKIGPYSNKMWFSQIRFCTRLNRETSRALYGDGPNHHHDEQSSEEWAPGNRGDDEFGHNDEDDNIGNK